MAFIGTTWWLWLILMVGFGGYAFYNQIRRMKGMKGMMSNGIEMDIEGSFKSFFKGVAPMVVASALSSLAGLLFIISIVVNIIDYVKG